MSNIGPEIILSKCLFDFGFKSRLFYILLEAIISPSAMYKTNIEHFENYMCQGFKYSVDNKKSRPQQTMLTLQLTDTI